MTEGLVSRDALLSDPLAGHPRYVKRGELGRGAHGFVQLAYDRLQQEDVAIKFIKRGSEVSNYVEREVLNHRKLNHCHVVQFKEIFLTQEYLAIVMEYVAGGNLHRYVNARQEKRLSEPLARWFFQQLILGLAHCHRRGVVSRDLKLHNTLLTDDTAPLVKICDFGFSKRVDMSDARSLVGTPAYLAPEVLNNLERQAYDAKVSDIWSCGVILYMMLEGNNPFERDEDTQPGRAPQGDVGMWRLRKVVTRILSADMRPLSPDRSPECWDLLKRILVAEPSNRLTLHHVVLHPWFQRDLPAGVMELYYEDEEDANCEVEYEDTQSVEEIRAIVAAARERVSGMSALFGSGTIDAEIDAALKEERLAGHLR